MASKPKFKRRLKKIDVFSPAMIRFLEESYLRVARAYGLPAPTSPKVWGHPRQKGVFEILNELLLRNGYRMITWDEFRELLKQFDSPRYYGIVYVSYGIGKTGKIEPLTIAIYKKLIE